MICPSAQGGKNWPAGAYSPQTNVMCMPMQNMCGNYTVTMDRRDPSKVYGLDFPTIIAPGTDKVGVVWAISAETGRTVWKYGGGAGVMSLVATGGGLVDRRRRGRPVPGLRRPQWQGPVGNESRLAGERLPITFAVDGKQYVAVATGTSGVASSTLRVTPELHPSTTGQVFVFALP